MHSSATYPRLKTDTSVPARGRVLDLDSATAATCPCLADLGLEPHGVEITEEICARAMARMKLLGVSFEARVGRNDASAV